jgi:hypothetical protein
VTEHDWPHSPSRRRDSRTLIALAVAVIAVVLLGAFVLRPAFVLGNDAEAVAASLAGELDERDDRGTGDYPGPFLHLCESGNDADFECSIQTIPSGDVGSGSTPKITRYAVDVSRFGCWNASKLESNPKAPGAPEADGCIGLFDY